MIPKFRVWDKHKKQMIEWIDLDLSKDSGGDDITVFEPTGIVRDAFLMPILLQSTGLKDKNGVEIFEGDVVKTKYGEHGRHIGVVKYGGAKFYSNGVKQYLSWHEDLNGLFEIIGNRYEHPHLLEGDNE